QLLSILEFESLYFSRTDQFEDDFEGSIPEATAEVRKKQFNEMDTPDNVDLNENFREGMRAIRKATYINCWHHANSENIAMWKLYSERDKGIVVLSNYGQFSDSISGAKDGQLYNDGLVNYVDFENSIVPRVPPQAPYFHKREIYQHEREFRAVITDFSQKQDDESLIESVEKGRYDKGMSVPVDVKGLISEIRVYPGAPDWYFDLIKSVVDSLGYEFEVNRSRLEGDPIH
ncbi:MAG: hypothetical protein ABEI86_01980, partial [Halobacteriaceae archaeon]